MAKGKFFAYLAFPDGCSPDGLEKVLGERFPGVQVRVYTRENRYGDRVKPPEIPPDLLVDKLDNDQVDVSFDFPLGLGGSF